MAQVEAGFRPDLDDVVTNVVAREHGTGNGWSISGDSTQGTDLVARFLRTLYQTDFGIVANHQSLTVEPYFQGRGYATALLAASFALYSKSGVAFVEMDAVGDGALVWPRVGWSLHGASVREVHNEVRSVYASYHAVMPPREFDLPTYGPDILELKDHAGNWIGEEALKRFAFANREIRMRLNLSDTRALASLRRRGII